VLAGLPLHFDEAQYWGWSRELAWGYYSKPPGIAAAIRAATLVCGDGEGCVRSIAWVSHALAGGFVFLAVRRLHGERTAAIATAIFATLPIAAFGAVAATTDALLILCWSAALYCYIRALEDDRARWWLGAGLAGGLGLLSKYTMGAFALSALVHLLSTPQLRARLASWKPWAAALVAAVVLAPNLEWNAMHAFATFNHTAEISQLDRAWLNPGELVAFLGGQLVVFGPVFGVAVFAALGAALRHGRRADARLWLWLAFTLPLLLIVGVQALLARANLNWAAPVAVGGAVLVTLLLHEGRRPRLLAAGLAVNLAIAIAVYHIVPAAGALGLPPRYDPVQRLLGWPELGAQVRTALAAHPGARLVGEDRLVVAELLYYARPESLGARIWNPGGRITDHYRLTADVAGAGRGPFVIATLVDRREALAADFHGLRSLGMVEGACARCARPRQLYLYLAEGFEGYRR